MTGNATPSIGVAVVGATGRMGREVIRALVSPDQPGGGFRLVAAVARSAQGVDAGTLAGIGPLGVAVRSDLAPLEGADVVIDFSLPGAASALFSAAAERALPLVSGTTGLDASAEQALKALAAKAPVCWAPNFSQGVTLLMHLARQATVGAGEGFDAEIVEMHHRHKRDAPSGTAVRLAEVVGEAKGIGRDGWVQGRSGEVGARPQKELGVMALRGGTVVGEHTLILAGEGERIELTHRGEDRAIFARGAVRAAAWLRGQAPGLYGMEDVMGLRSQV